MIIEIVDKKENPLLGRIELHFRASHDGTSTPKREEIRQAIAQEEDVKKDNVVIDNMDPEFGRAVTQGYAKIYKDLEKARSIEREHILKRNNLYLKKEKKEE